MPTQLKRCTLCGKNKALFEFSIKKKSKKKREKHCDTCRATYKVHHKHLAKKHSNQNYYMGERIAKHRRPRQREKLRLLVYRHLMEHSCVDCGETDPIILEFDHVNGHKRFGISQGVSLAVPTEELISEIAKCEIRCCNCHRKKTVKEMGYKIGQIEEVVG